MRLDDSERLGPTKNRNLAQRMAAMAGNVLILTVSIVVSLFIAEAAYRIAMGVPLFAATDWRQEGFRSNRIGDRGIYDPVLGWTLKANYRREGFNTLDHGIRRNFSETGIRTGGILAVGDSFTEGFDEVEDWGSWPAHLEKMMGVPVINAGVAGYGTDQIILRAEQLIATVNPKTIVVGILEFDLSRTAHSEAGAPKPYFTTENGALVYHPPGPLEPKRDAGAVSAFVRSILGYSALADHLASRAAPRFWHPSEASVFKQVDNDPREITCLLLQRLKRRTDETKIRLLVFTQYSGERVLAGTDISPDMRSVTECAQKAGIQVVDQFAPLQALIRGNPDLLATYYNRYHDGEFGHMFSKGNEHAAQLLAQALRVEPEAPGAALEPSVTPIR